jgi:hypothetical protein
MQLCYVREQNVNMIKHPGVQNFERSCDKTSHCDAPLDKTYSNTLGHGSIFNTVHSMSCHETTIFFEERLDSQSGIVTEATYQTHYLLKKSFCKSLMRS